MLQNRHEKVTYINEAGESIALVYSFPYFFQSLSGTDGLTAEVTRVRSIGQDGSTVTNVQLVNREINLSGVIKGTSKTEIASRRARLLKVFSPKSKGTILYEYGDVKRKIDCQVEVGPKFSKIQTFKYQSFIIDILCPNPFWTNQEPTNLPLASFEGGFTLPLEFSIDFGTVGTQVIIDNAGDVETPVLLELKGQLVNPIIKNVTANEEIKINRTIAANETLEIGTEKGNVFVKVNGANAFHYVDDTSNFFRLAVGENKLEYTASESDTNSSCTISYYTRYLGV